MLNALSNASINCSLSLYDSQETMNIAWIAAFTPFKQAEGSLQEIDLDIGDKGEWEHAWVPLPLAYKYCWKARIGKTDSIDEHSHT